MLNADKVIGTVIIASDLSLAQTASYMANIVRTVIAHCAAAFEKRKL